MSIHFYLTSCNIYNLSGTILNILQIFTYLILITIIWDKYYYYLHFTFGKTEAQKCEVSCSRLHSQSVILDWFQTQVNQGSRIWALNRWGIFNLLLISSNTYEINFVIPTILEFTERYLSRNEQGELVKMSNKKNPKYKAKHDFSRGPEY